MKNLEISVLSVDELPNVARSILKFAEDKKVFALYGDMGAGKTTLIKEICKQLGSADSFSSPTYSIVNEYLMNEDESKIRDKIYHIDLYRLKKIEEAIEVGIEDYLTGESYCFIEWPELVERLLPDDIVKIEMKPDGNLRNLSIFRN
ncbi:MAG: tRNA (adenosine(37)-N6)-threonylcarbamoyltransferase complex ATPase subunit type 1 TsaE [Bacteroidetes bacterium]|nr:tRNA (adenosine(37)-N6)-threonylcarbamoyltransferase complex ATPase subunit type 1 TsaE [Bacteroidota bacterium]